MAAGQRGFLKLSVAMSVSATLVTTAGACTPSVQEPWVEPLTTLYKFGIWGFQDADTIATLAHEPGAVGFSVNPAPDQESSVYPRGAIGGHSVSLQTGRAFCESAYYGRTWKINRLKDLRQGCLVVQSPEP
jgi:hypothetical protein